MDSAACKGRITGLRKDKITKAVLELAEQGPGVSDGLHIKTGNTDLSASDQSLRTLSDTFTHWWFGTLEWLGTHPIYGGLVFGLAFLALGMWFNLRRTRQRLDYEYKIHRLNVQVQPTLPFPETEGKMLHHKSPRLGRPKQEKGDDDA